MRRYLAFLLPLFLIACGQPSDRYARMRMPSGVADLEKSQGGENQAFSYMHAIALMMPHASVEPRYERARDRCLHDAALNCKLISASLDKSEGDNASYSAQLVVALPHGKIAAFEKDLTNPVGGEAKGDAAVTSSSSSAQNVTQYATTASRKVAQLSDYRDRLSALLKRPNLSVDDLIKVEGELAKTQSELDEALSQKTDVEDRVAREQVSISLTERPRATSSFRPIVEAWEDSTSTLADSTADALRFFVRLIPWLPLIAGAIFFLRWIWRIARRRPSDARSGPG